MKTIVTQSTFDPITNGHIDLVERASKLFDKVIIGIASSERKILCLVSMNVFSLRRNACNMFPMLIHGFNVLLVNFVKECKADAIMRGLRAVSDFEYEPASQHEPLCHPISRVYFLRQLSDFHYLFLSSARNIFSTRGRQPIRSVNVAEALNRKFASLKN